MKHQLNTVHIDDRFITPSKIVCIGRNYVDHITELGNEIPDDMVVFMKPNSAISTELRVLAKESLHYEGEICFVYENSRFSAVGFGLDLTKRRLQTSLKSKGLPWERAKAFDGSAIFSPFVELSTISSSLAIELDINGKTVQSGSVSLMMYKPEGILRELQTFITLHDGDIVMTGTPAGVGEIHAGDVFEGKIKLNDDIITTARWEVLPVKPEIV